MKLKYYCIVLFLVLFVGISTAQINTGSPIIAFNSNTSYPFGMLPTNLPSSGAYGKSTDAGNAYNTWKTNYVVSCGTTPTQYRVRFDNPAQTVSEGIGYGMLLAGYAADKDLFDGLWTFYKAHTNGNGVMNWQLTGCTNSSTNGATDAELDAALALLVAETQWPSATSPYDYQTEANSLLGKIKNLEIDPANYQANNGDSWGNGADCRNPSYQAPGYYKVFGQVSGQDNTFWGTNCVNGAYTLLNTNTNNTSGLASDWCSKSGSTNACQSGSTSGQFGYDACRNPWRMAVDYIWTGESRANAICNKIAAYVNGKTGNIGGPVSQTTTAAGGIHNATFVSMFAAGIMGSTNNATNQATLNAMYTQTVNTSDAVNTSSQPSGYFGNTLKVISLFMMTGNFWKPGSSPTPEINVKQGSTTYLSGSNLNLGNVTQGTTKGTVLTIQNLGAQSLTISGITLTGTDASKFSISGAPTSVAANSSGTFTVNVTPGANVTGTFVADVNISSNDNTGSENPYVIHLTIVSTQNSTAPEIDVNYNGSASIASGSTYNLGNITQSAKGYYIFTISNTGDAPLNISNIVLTGTGVTPYGTNPTFVQAGGSATFIVSILANSSTGTQTGTITISNDDSNEGTYVINFTISVSACNTTLGVTHILQDYEGNNNVVYEYKTAGVPSLPKGPWNANGANPSMDATNPTPIVGSFIRRQSDGTYDQLRYLPCGTSTFNVTAIPGISIMVYSPRAGVEVKLSCKSAAGNALDAVNYTTDINVLTTKVNQWEKLFFNLAPLAPYATSPGVGIFDIMIDATLTSMTAAGATTMQYYIDQIQYDVPPCTATPTISAATATTFCSPGSVTLTATTSTPGVTYQWQNGGTNITGATGSTYSATTSGSYTVTATDGKCPATSAATVVTVNATPATPTISASGNLSFCSGGSVTLTATTSTSGVTYQWKNGGTNISGATSSTYSAAATGSYTVTVTSGSCSATSTATSVTVNSAPATPVISAGGNTNFCSGGSVLLTASTTTSNVTYQWNSGGTPIAGATSSTYSATTSGSYTVTASLGTCSTTSAATTVTVTASPSIPTISVDGPVSFCTGGSVNLTATTSTSGVTYQWKSGGTNISGATNSIYSATTTGSYSVTITSGACSATSTATSVNVNSAPAMPTISAGGNTSFCSGGNVILTANTSTSGVTYQWNNGGTLIAGATAATYSAIASGNYTVTASSGACSSTSTATSVSVTASPSIPTINAGGPVSFCTGGNVILSAATSTGGVTYQWKNGGANIAGASASTYSATATGSYTVVVTSGSCSSTSSATSVTVSSTPAAPTIGISGASTICSGNSVHLSATTSASNPSYQWNEGGIPLSGATASTYDASTSGTYTLIVSTNGCASTASASVSITVLPTQSVSVSISGSNSICNGNQASFTANPSGTGSLQWMVNGNNVGTNNTSFQSNSLVNGDQITCKYTSDATCVTSTSATSNAINMQVTDAGAASVTINQTEGTNPDCAGNYLSFTAIPVNGGIPIYQWKVNGINVGTNNITYSSTSLADGDAISCMMTSSLSCATGSPVTSNVINIGITPLGTGSCGSTGINGSISTTAFSLYPNPFSDETLIKSSSSFISNVSIRITDVKGQLVYSGDNENITDLRIGKRLIGGVYIVQIYAEGVIQVFKIVKID